MHNETFETRITKLSLVTALIVLSVTNRPYLRLLGRSIVEMVILTLSITLRARAAFRALMLNASSISVSKLLEYVGIAIAVACIILLSLIV